MVPGFMICYIYFSVLGLDPAERDLTELERNWSTSVGAIQ